MKILYIYQCQTKVFFECCEYPMKVCDEAHRDFETSNDNRVSINIHQVHQKELQICYSNEFDLPDDVLNTTNDIIRPMYHIKNTNNYAKHIALRFNG